MPVLIVHRASTGSRCRLSRGGWELSCHLCSLFVVVSSLQSVVLHETWTPGLKEVHQYPVEAGARPVVRKQYRRAQTVLVFRVLHPRHCCTPDWPECPPTFPYIRRIHCSREPEAVTEDRLSSFLRNGGTYVLVAVQKHTQQRTSPFTSDRL